MGFRLFRAYIQSSAHTPHFLGGFGLVYWSRQFDVTIEMQWNALQMESSLPYYTIHSTIGEDVCGCVHSTAGAAATPMARILYIFFSNFLSLQLQLFTSCCPALRVGFWELFRFRCISFSVLWFFYFCTTSTRYRAWLQKSGFCESWEMAVGNSTCMLFLASNLFNTHPKSTLELPRIIFWLAPLLLQSAAGGMVWYGGTFIYFPR